MVSEYSHSCSFCGSELFSCQFGFTNGVTVGSWTVRFVARQIIPPKIAMKCGKKRRLTSARAHVALLLELVWGGGGVPRADLLLVTFSSCQVD